MSTRLTARSLGSHLKSLRKARGLTQEQLADRSNVSADTVRRLEKGVYMASIETVDRLALGFGLELSTLFEGYELNELDPQRELVDLLRSRRADEMEMITRIVRLFVDELDRAERNRSGEG